MSQVASKEYHEARSQAHATLPPFPRYGRHGSGAGRHVAARPDGCWLTRTSWRRGEKRLKTVTYCPAVDGVQKSGVHQLRLVVYPIIYDGFYTSQVVVWDVCTINSSWNRGWGANFNKDVGPKNGWMNMIDK